MDTPDMDDDFTHWDERRLAQHADEELVARIRDARDHGRADAAADAFEHLVHRHEKRVRGLLHNVPADRVEDLLQDVFMAAFEGVIGGRDIDIFRAWLAQVARNTVAEMWRGKQGRQIKLDREAAAREGGDPDRPLPEPASDGGYGGIEAQHVVDQLLRRRSEAHRRVVELYVIEQLSAAEAARVTGESANNVYKVAERFRRDLRRALDGEDLHDNDDPGSGREDRTQER
jgi:RNA polymerase sigma factor (sigma-70 family)